MGADQLRPNCNVGAQLREWTPECFRKSVVQTSEESLTCSADHTSLDRDGRELGNSPDFRLTMPNADRRLCRRLDLHWRLRLSATGIGTVETRTENLSSRGFYCFLETPLVPGDIITC